MFKLRMLVLGSVIAFSPALLAQEEEPQQDHESAQDEEKQSGDWLEDTETTARVKAALIDHDKAPAGDIDVEVQRGVVQLSGFVESEEAKQAAEEAAGAVEGVSDVRNELIVREGDRTTGQAVDDTVIAAKVKSELAGEAGLDTATDVTVEVRGGVVQLGGFVASAEQKSRAAEVARGVEGVADVRNDIAVQR